MDALDGGFWQFGDDSSPPTGVTFFAGTFVRHPLVMAAARISTPTRAGRTITPRNRPERRPAEQRSGHLRELPQGPRLWDHARASL
jgi:hypothetical protein